MQLLHAFWIGARPRTLPAAIVPVLIGSALAWRVGLFQLPPFLAALLASVLIQIGTNLANDVADFERGADRNRKGPIRITQAGLATPQQTKAMTILSFALAALLGAYLISVGGWPIAAIGVLSIAAGIAYTAGPFPLAYNGLGDVFAFLFFGVIAVCGTYFLHTGMWDWLVFAASLPVAMLVTNIIVVNNTRDIDTDSAAHKRTLAVLIGPAASRLEYTIFIFGAVLIGACVMAYVRVQSADQGAASLVVPALLFAMFANLAREHVRDFNAAEKPAEFNSLLKATATYHLLFGAMFALGISAS